MLFEQRVKLALSVRNCNSQMSIKTRLEEKAIFGIIRNLTT